MDEKEGRLKLVKKVAKDRVVSTVDPDARHVHKSRKAYIDGYRGHIAIDPETELITSSALRKGNVSNAQMGENSFRDNKSPSGSIATTDTAQESFPGTYLKKDIARGL